MTTNPTPDVLVVGAGTAGAAAAAHLAEAGRDVLAVDRRPPDRAGACWSNAIPGWLFDEARVARPEPPERERDGNTHRAVLADAWGRVCATVEPDPGLHVHMAPLTRRLQQRAQDAGARFLQARVNGVQLDGPRLAAVHLTTPDGPLAVRPRLAVDASGGAATLRRRVPLLADACPAPGPTDWCLAAQHTHRVTDPAAARAFLDRIGARPGDGYTRMGEVGGYSILMLSVNEEGRTVGLLSGTVPADGAVSPQRVLRRFVAENPWVGERLAGGGGPIPLGQPHTRPTAPGVALVGDAAGHVYGVHGSGVGMGLVAARLLADAVSEAGDPADPDALHGYAHRFLSTYGGRLAAADLFRRHSQTLSAADVAELMASGLVGRSMLATGLMQSPFELDPAGLGALVRGGLRHPWLAARLAPLALRMLRLQAAFDDYPATPDPDRLKGFDARLRHIRGF